MGQPGLKLGGFGLELGRSLQADKTLLHGVDSFEISLERL